MKDNDYARHVHRRWIDTHGQSLKTDPSIFLPGEVAAEEFSEDSDGDYGQKESGLATRSSKVY